MPRSDPLTGGPDTAPTVRNTPTFLARVPALPPRPGGGALDPAARGATREPGHRGVGHLPGRRRLALRAERRVAPEHPRRLRAPGSPDGGPDAHRRRRGRALR